jgi:hypothetical protein
MGKVMRYLQNFLDGSALTASLHPRSSTPVIPGRMHFDVTLF